MFNLKTNIKLKTSKKLIFLYLKCANNIIIQLGPNLKSIKRKLRYFGDTRLITMMSQLYYIEVLLLC